MSWLYSRALVEASSVDISSAGAPSVPSSASPTPRAFSWLDRTTDRSRRSRSGMTSAPLTDAHGEAVLTWCLAASLVRTSASPAREPDSTESEAGSGSTWPGSFAKWDHVTSSWRTPQSSIGGGSTAFSGTWPRWGSMRSGECTARSKPALLTSASGRGLLPRIPTPTVGDSQASGSRNTPTSKAHPGTSLTDFVRQDGGRGREMGVIAAGGKLNPTWVEWLMRWPLGWTDCEPLATGRFRQWCDSHGMSWSRGGANQ